MPSGGKCIGRTDYRQGRAEQPDQGASMRPTDLKVWEVALTPILAVRERPPHDGPPTVPKSRPGMVMHDRLHLPPT